MIAFGREAKRWAKYLGAPAAVVARASHFEERLSSEYDLRGSAVVFDADGVELWHRARIARARTATRRVAIDAGWETP